MGFSIAAGLCILLGFHVYVASRAATAREAVQLHRVTAVTVTQPFQAGIGVSIATVDWTDVTGDHVMQARVPASTGPGDHVVIWVDRNDVPQAAPIPPVQSLGTALAYSVPAFAGAATLLIGAHAWARYVLNKRVERSWEEEWAQVEPEWNPRGRRG